MLVANQGFSIENDCLTPIARAQLLKKYQKEVDAMYAVKPSPDGLLIDLSRARDASSANAIPDAYPDIGPDTILQAEHPEPPPPSTDHARR